ncbi:MAG: mandelate racemase/muconate lactonizing enzyme family protein [Nitrososphaerota archaeon]|nr:mandelate racemase/muconate lactonizing enzyme family protein [Nitrososphaerota archaeon]MDG6939155.1 mandelate racemase/muconate lactonizing enzyme family protein [Nitrososphaerota archaeon]
MKIIEAEVFQVGEPASAGGATWAGNSILLRLTTSDGLVGWGEAVPTLRVQPVIQSLHEVARVYRGKDPLDVERNWHEWHRHDFYLPVSFESTTAVSAFDIACWDIMGKHYGAPIHKLMGGTFRDRIRLYANGWYDGCVSPEDFGGRAKKYAGMGYTALKFDPFGSHYDSIDRAGLEQAHARVKAVRDATGGRVDLLIEHHGRFDPNSAIAAANALEEFDPLFMEEPVHPENVEGMKKYRSATRLRVALGERLLTKEQALQALRDGLADFLQADITNIGGVTQARKVAAVAEAFGVEMAFHNAFGPIQNAATLQVDACIPNFLVQESFYDCFPQWKRELIRDGTPVVGGHSSAPDRPGLGVDVDERVLEEHRVEGQEYFDPEEPVWVVKGTWKEF